MSDSIRNLNDTTAAKVISAATGDSGANHLNPDDKSEKVCKDCGMKMPASSEKCPKCDAPAGSKSTDSGESMNTSYAKSIGLQLSTEELNTLLAAKSVGVDKIFHYAFLWGSDKVVDIENEYFTKSSDLWDTHLGKIPRPLTWDHAMDPSMKASPIIGKTLEYGDDEIGRWAVSQLDRAHEYRKAIDALIERRILGSSSDSAPQYVERVQTGKAVWLKTWPWFATALTVQPCEPRMVKTVDYFKSIGVSVPNLDATAYQLQVMKLKARRIFSL